MKSCRLPDGSRLPLVYTLPAATACKAGTTRYCQHANGLRAAGFRDPQVMPNDEPIIKAAFGDFRLTFVCNAAHRHSIAGFDAGHADPEGTEYVLPKPVQIVPIKRHNTVRRKKRRDAGMTKAEADRRFKRQPGEHAGRRYHTIKYLEATP